MNAYKKRRPWRRALLVMEALLLTMLVDGVKANGDDKAAKTCYFPSGGIAFGGLCNPDAEFSGCCPFGWSCLSNGLCKTNPGNENNFKYKYYRSSCTDQSWHSPLCTQLCRDSGDNTDAGNGLQLCDEEKGTYCCAREIDCCTLANSSFFHLGPPNVLRTLPRPHAAEIADQPKRGSMAKDTVVGVAVGFSIAAVVFLLVWVFWIWRRRRLERKRLSPKDGGNAAELDATETASAMNMVRKNNETEVTQLEVAELESPNSTERSELDASSTWRSGTWDSTISPATDMASLGTLVTSDIVELEAANLGVEKGSVKHSQKAAKIRKHAETG